MCKASELLVAGAKAVTVMVNTCSLSTVDMRLGPGCVLRSVRPHASIPFTCSDGSSTLCCHLESGLDENHLFVFCVVACPATQDLYGKARHRMILTRRLTVGVADPQGLAVY